MEISPYGISLGNAIAPPSGLSVATPCRTWRLTEHSAAWAGMQRSGQTWRVSVIGCVALGCEPLPSFPHKPNWCLLQTGDLLASNARLPVALPSLLLWPCPAELGLLAEFGRKLCGPRLEAIFPHMPDLCRALLLTAKSWSVWV